MARTRVAIMGLGRIGAGYSDAADTPRSHLAAARRNPDIEVTALIDRDRSQLDSVGQRAPDAMKLNDLAALPSGTADVLVDATNRIDRAEVIRIAAARDIRVVILEKPAATSIKGAKAVCDAAKSGIQVRVNFHRRFDPRHVAIKTAMTKLPAAVVAAYSNGLLNYGSHLIDLMLDWMGTIKAVRSDGPWTNDADPTPSFEVLFEDGRRGSIIGVPGLNWDVFNATFLGSFGKIELGNGGADLALFRPVQDLVYPGYVHLGRDDAASTLSSVSGLPELYASLCAHVGDQTPLRGATAEDALAGIEVIDAVRRSALAGGTWQKTKHAA